MKALFSIHDVMPETLAAVAETLDHCETSGIRPLTLLVVPGREWDPAGLATLRNWAGRGHELAAHGWVHRTRPRRLYHRIHAFLVSRTVAEHLACEPDEVCGLMQRSGDWFARNGLPAPVFYVPPAWALGRLSPAAARTLPFERIETTSGFRFTQTWNRVPLPLVGYEADTRLRAVFLKGWNALQIRRAKRSGRPLRVSIHPHDLHLRLGDDLREILRRPWSPILPAAVSESG